MMPERDPLTEKVIGIAIELHRALGPGLLESAYRDTLCWDLNEAGLLVRKEVPLPVVYKGVTLDCGYRLDLVVDNRLIIELKTVEKILPVHEARLLTYLGLSRIRLGLQLNFYVPVLKDGIGRVAL